MKRCLLFAFLILSSVYFFASNPNWLDKYQRDLLYSRDNYFIGFVQTEIEYDYQYEETVKRLKEQARFELISSIRVTVQSVQTNVSQSDQIIGTQGFESSGWHSACPSSIFRCPGRRGSCQWGCN